MSVRKNPLLPVVIIFGIIVVILSIMLFRANKYKENIVSNNERPINPKDNVPLSIMLSNAEKLMDKHIYKEKDFSNNERPINPKDKDAAMPNVNENPIITTTPDDIFKDYVTNGILAKAKYEGKIINVVGDSGSPFSLRDGTFSLRVYGKDQGLTSRESIDCDLPWSYKERLENIKSGQKVIVQGLYEHSTEQGSLVMGQKLLNCILVAVEQ